MYRGVRKATYLLVPKVGRADTFKSDGQYSLEMEEQMFIQFKRRAFSYLSDPHLMSQGEWLMHAQHHGLPTRLLDWSESILIAAYFAVEASGTEGDAAIYSMEINETVFTNIEQPFDKSKTLIVSPPSISPRIVAQQGLFTLHHEPDQPFHPPTLKKYVIPRDACLRLRMTLDEVGVNRATLFPDLDGLSQNIAWKFKWLGRPRYDKVPER